MVSLRVLQIHVSVYSQFELKLILLPSLIYCTGTCPPAADLDDPWGECLDSSEYHGGCWYDDECAGPTRKCCKTKCGYEECVEIGRHQLPAHAGPVAVAAASFIVSFATFRFCFFSLENFILHVFVNDVVILNS